MTSSHAKLRLDPDLCDRCGRCIDACKPGVLKIGPSYIYVDWRNCDGCYECVELCDRGAIERREARSGVYRAPVRQEKSRPREAKGKGSTKEAKSKAKAAQPTSSSGTGDSWTLLEAFAMLMVVFALFVAKDVVLNAGWVAAMSPSDVVLTRVVVLAVFYAVQFVSLWSLVRFRGGNILEAFSLGRIDTPLGSKLRSIGLVVALLFGTRVLVLIYQLIARAVDWQAPNRWNSDLTTVFGPDMTGFALSVGMVIIVAPIIEELVFRGVLLDAFSARWGMWPGIVISATLFGIYHFNMWLLVPTLVLGLATGWLAYTRRSLWPAIALHVLFNAVPVIAFWAFV